MVKLHSFKNTSQRIIKMFKKRIISPQKFPYPYQAAIAFSNDCEFQTEKCYQFFRDKIDANTGYNIKISHSLFFYTTNAICHSSISYFDGISKKKTQYANFLKELNQSKLIDTLHSYGDFDKGGFNRQLALNALEIAQKESLSFSIYSNHGTSENKQNIGHLELQNYQEGDIPNSNFYHADLTDAMGVKFFWCDEASDISYLPRENLLYKRFCRDGKSRNFFFRYRGLAGLPIL